MTSVSNTSDDWQVPVSVSLSAATPKREAPISQPLLNVTTGQWAPHVQISEELHAAYKDLLKQAHEEVTEGGNLVFLQEAIEAVIKAGGYLPGIEDPF